MLKIPRGLTSAGFLAKGKLMENEDIEQEEVDALCRECGHAFKTHIDRIIPPEKTTKESQAITCPVCGCGECNIGK